MCFVCGTEVPEAGQSCSSSCWEHFTTVVSNQSSIVEMESFIDSAEQPWSGFENDAA